MATNEKSARRPRPAAVGLVSLGCAKNAVDLQVMAGHLVKAGFKLAPDPDRADVVLVNTCAFIEAAREEAADEILRACELKRAGRCRAVVVAGCFAQRYGARLAEAFPEVDAFLGIDALDRVAAAARAALDNSKAKGKSPKAVLDLPPETPCRTFSPPQPALRFTGISFAYLKIAEGCAHRCSYCAIPGIRGPYRSRPAEDILAEARALVETGAKELVVVAQDPMLYGVDLRGAGKTDLVGLLRRIDDLKGDFRVRVLYSYPSEITADYLDWLAHSPRAIKYADVPLQHTHPAILKAMGRAAAVDATLSAADRLRAAVPGITLRTTVMTGFPGETDAIFRKMLDDLKRMDFDRLGAFAFSPEEGTVAAELDGRVAPAVAERRRRQVMNQQARLWRVKSKALVGKTFPALVVAPGVARMESQAPDVDGVTRIDPESAAVGEVVTVRIDAVDGFDFAATVV